MTDVDVVEKSIRELSELLDGGETTSVGLVEAYLRRIAAFDRQGLLLNSVVRINPAVFEEAQAADRRRAAGESRGLLDGIPFTAKDSYSVKGMPVSAGSPAFADLVAGQDAHAVAVLRRRGAVFLGLTNMPPMADGGMQRGLYGRAESPYNENFLAAAYQSGSSNGSGTSTAASFAAFGLGEETWSSGRAPASNGGLAAYTPSRGVISVRGNWPLVPTMDVVVPHARSVDDLCIVSSALSEADAGTAGDFWREQPYVALPEHHPLPDHTSPVALSGLGFAVPDMYLNRDPDSTRPIETRASIVELFERMLTEVAGAGAVVRRTDFPAVSNYEGDRAGAPTLDDRGIVPAAFLKKERHDLTVYAWDRFLRLNDDPNLHALADVDGPKIFPQPEGAVPFSDQTDVTIADYVTWAQRHVPVLDEIDEIGAGLHGLERTRKIDFEEWLSQAGLDAVLLPTVGDIGPFDADFNPESNRLAMRNGTWVANGNLVFRHLGIPTVTVTLGVLPDIHMPVGVTIAGPSGADERLFAIASALEQLIAGLGEPFGRHEPNRLRERQLSPVKAGSPIPQATAADAEGVRTTPPAIEIAVAAGASDDEGTVEITVTGRVERVSGLLRVTVNAGSVPVIWADAPAASEHAAFTARTKVSAHDLYRLHSTWRGPYGALAVAVVEQESQPVAAAWATTGEQC
ncbi:amidase [Pseudoclavibacter sp. CFCC 14310]|uniref:amidase n=1 Tax=Pseudoclavibacter sp. CFCC 14310 TaxID=2615180 RepID=UPI0013013921|nr:amidase [Pseudoclavibacter sp. CFCC 14310]KAB1644562.1 amidase [Pseudoclavibacter sp. CFCC 14310]